MHLLFTYVFIWLLQDEVAKLQKFNKELEGVLSKNTAELRNLQTLKKERDEILIQSNVRMVYL